MPKTPLPFGITLTPEGNGYTFRQKISGKKTITIRLSAEELYGLRATIALLTDRLRSNAQVESGTVSPIVVHPVAQVHPQLDALEANLLLTVAAPSGEQMTLELPQDVAEHLVDQLPALLSQMRSATPRQ
jgi:uncharacterized protein YqfB (UPF0267 family)